MALLTTQTMSRAGVTPTYAAASAGGDTFITGDDVYLHFKNTGGSAITVTVDAVQACNQGFDHNAAVVVPATTGDKLIGPFPSNIFGGTGSITYSAVTGLTVAVVRLPSNRTLGA